VSVTLRGQTTAANGVPGSPPPAAPALLPWSRLISGLAAVPAITRLGVQAADENVDLWVVLQDEDDAAEAEVSRLEREYRVAVGPSPFELHVVPLTSVDEANLPPFETIFAR
jgi:hypothetical protein